IGTRRPQFSEPCAIVTIHKPKHSFVVLHRADEEPGNRDLSAEKGDDLGLHFPALSLLQRPILLSAERLFTFVMHGDVARGAVYDLERCLVTGLVIVVPGAHAVVTEQNSPRLWIGLNQLLDLQTDIKSRSLPRDVNYVVAVDFLCQFFLVD